MYPGVHCFPDGQDFKQWTGDDSKALMKVRILFSGMVLFTYRIFNMGQIYIAAICGHVPQDMVQCLSVFMNYCYIVCCNAITTSNITHFQHHLADFHQFWQIFITTGARKDFSLPCQHALMHYPNAIELWGSPNGTCTS